MGQEQGVTFAGKAVPPWPAVRALLEERGFAVVLRMIDGELAFPDEQPSEGWRELRVGTPAGMVTLRREGERVLAVVWGNADAALLQARNALLWALAKGGGGTVEASQGAALPDEFARHADLPVGFHVADH